MSPHLPPNMKALAQAPCDVVSAIAVYQLGRLIYTMLTKGEEYTDQGQAYYEERYRERVLRQLSQRANKLGMQLVAAPQTA